MKGSKFPIEPIYSEYFGEGGILAMKTKHKQEKKEAVKKAVSNRIKKVAGPVSRPAMVVKDGLQPIYSRTELMKEAQTFGIKNFRVLNKAELKEAVDIAALDPKLPAMDNLRIKEIVHGAVARWKSGWSKKKSV